MRPALARSGPAERVEAREARSPARSSVPAPAGAPTGCEARERPVTPAVVTDREPSFDQNARDSGSHVCWRARIDRLRQPIRFRAGSRRADSEPPRKGNKPPRPGASGLMSESEAPGSRRTRQMGGPRAARPRERGLLRGGSATGHRGLSEDAPRLRPPERKAGGRPGASQATGKAHGRSPRGTGTGPSPSRHRQEHTPRPRTRQRGRRDRHSRRRARRVPGWRGSSRCEGLDRPSMPRWSEPANPRSGIERDRPAGSPRSPRPPATSR